MSLLDSFGGLGRSSRRRPEVREGGVFRCSTSRGIVETAKVLSLVPDHMGITHVCYHLTVESPSHKGFDERRTLTLDSFKARYPETVNAAMAV